MKITKSRLDKVEKALIAKNRGNILKLVPRDWGQFMALTRIRSVGKDGAQMMNFHPYTYQKVLHWLAQQYSELDVVKTRQIGVTTCVGGIFLHSAAINEAFSGVMFMRNQVDTSHLSKRIRTMVDALKEYIKPDSDSVSYLKLLNLGELHFRNSGKEGCRSLDAVSALMLDELAFIPTAGDIYSASKPSQALLGDKATAINCSTPGARSGFFWDKINTDNPSDHTDIQSIADQVAEGRLYSQFKGRDIPGLYWWECSKHIVRVMIHFRCHPVYGRESPEKYLQFKKAQQPGSSDEEIQREYNLKFVDSSMAVFAPDLIESIINSDLSYEETPDPDAKYYMGVDTATTGADYVCAPILKLKNNKYSLAHMYRVRHKTHQYHQYKLAQIIKVFRPVQVSIETTGGVGTLYLEKLAEMCPAIRMEGVATTGDSKPQMVAFLQLAMELGDLLIPPDERVIKEFLSFRRIGKQLEAAEGKDNHDDIIMGLCFALTGTPFNYQKQIEIKISGDNISNSFYDDISQEMGIGVF